MKRPAFQFYPGDWQRDSALRACSIGARGLWIEMMCVMHQAEPYGHLVLNGKAIGAAQLARMAGAREAEVRRWLSELESAGVYSKDAEGRIFSRRMVRDEHLRNVRAEGGKLGAEHGYKGAEHGAKGGRPTAARGVSERPLEPSPSSSSSSSVLPLTPSGQGKRQRPRTGCPDEFDVTDDMAAWAVEKGLPGDRLQPETEKFLNHHRAKGNRFSDWTAAWRNWVDKAVEFSQPRAAHG